MPNSNEHYMDYESIAPDARVMTTVGTRDSIGIFDPMQGPDEYPIMSLSEQSAYELGVALIAQAANADPGMVRAALRSKAL